MTPQPPKPPHPSISVPSSRDSALAIVPQTPPPQGDRPPDRGHASRADRATIATQWLRWVLPTLLILEAGLAAVYLGSIAQGHPIAWIDFNGRATLPSLLQASHLLGLAALCGVRLLRTESRTPSRPVLRFLVFALTFAAADEVFKIHLMSSTEFVRHAFIGVYFAAIVTLPVLFCRDLKIVWRLDRGSIILAASGLGLFCLGGFASGWIRDGLIAPLWPLLSHRTGGVEYVRIAIEELGELWGETCLFLAALRFQWITATQPTPRSHP